MKKTIGSFLAIVALGSSASAATYFENFDSGVLTQGESLNGTAILTGGALQLSVDGGASGFGSFGVPAIANSSLGWTATYDYTIFDSVGANEPADGFSLNYGNAAITELGSAEEGMAGAAAVSDNVSFEVDTWMNLDTEQGVNIAEKVGGVDTNLAFTNGSILSDGTTVSGTATMVFDPVAGLSFTTTGLLTNAGFANVATTFTGSDAYTFVLSSRVGGANQTVTIDNLRITTIPEPSGVALIGLAGVGMLLRRRR